MDELSTVLEILRGSNVPIDKQAQAISELNLVLLRIVNLRAFILRWKTEMEKYKNVYPKQRRQLLQNFIDAAAVILADDAPIANWIGQQKDPEGKDQSERAGG